MIRNRVWIACAAAVSVMSFLSKVAVAEPVVVAFSFNISNEFDYAMNAYVPFTDSGTATVTFENTLSYSTDYGATTISSYMRGTNFASPLTTLIGPDPYGIGVADAFNYTFPNVSDYSTTFIEQFAAQGNEFSYSGAANRFWSYHIELRVSRYQPSRGGTGAADYVFTPQDNVDFLNEALRNPSAFDVEFSESYQLYDYATSSELGGYLWSDYNARLLSVTAQPVRVHFESVFQRASLRSRSTLEAA